MNYLDYCIDRRASVREAMKRLDVLLPKILFVTQGHRLVGSLTDGDIRRFLLHKGRMEDAVEAAANLSPRYAYHKPEAAELYKKLHYPAIPIVGEDMHIKALFIGGENENLPAAQLNIPVVINAGGRGTRLDPYTKILPKPLIPVGDLPILEHIMRSYQHYACEKFHVIVNYKKQLIKAYFAESDSRYQVTWYDEALPLGTGGGLSLLKGEITQTFFFTNCDILLQSDYADILAFHRKNGNAVTMVCAYKNLTIPYGVIEIGENGWIEAMREKPELSFLTNTGMYIVEPEVLEDMNDGEAIGFPDVIARQLHRGRPVAAYPVSENEWLDMGQLSELEKMRNRLKENHKGADT